MLGLTIIVTAMLVSLGGGYAIAKSDLNPVSDTGVIRPVYQKSSGILRLINGPDDVTNSEEYVSWNQMGSEGL